MTDIAEILARAKLPEDTVTLCVRADLVAEFEQLETRLRTASRVATSLAEPAEATAIARRMEELRAEMVDSQVEFHLRAWPARRFAPIRDALKAMQPGKDETEEQWADRWHAAICDLVSKAVIEPQMTPEQVAQLADALSDAQWQQLSDAAWNVNSSKLPIPFSVAASATLANDATK